MNEEDNDVKDIIKGAKKVANEVKKLIKAMFKTLKVIFRRAGYALIIIALIGLFYFVITKSTAEKASKSGQEISEGSYVSYETGKLAISDDTYNNIRQDLIEEGIDPASYFLDDKHYLDHDYTYLEKMVQAEVVSSSIDTGVGDLRGIVKIKRKSSEGKETDLTYKTPTEFEELCKATEESKIEEALKFFTISETNQLVIPRCFKQTFTDAEGNETTTYTVEAEYIDYKQSILKYTMPYEYLFVLLQITLNPEYVVAVADLAMEGEIELTVFDNKRIETTEAQSSYDKTTETTISDWWEETVGRSNNLGC